MKYKISLINLGIITMMLSGCSVFKSHQAKSDFDTNPNNYKMAQMAKDVNAPEYIANNLEKQALFPVPPADNLSGDLNVSPVPPNLVGKIAE